jgi:hypothetical protein
MTWGRSCFVSFWVVAITFVRDLTPWFVRGYGCPTRSFEEKKGRD